jgi:predicted metal-dependent phosphoesterase TrpH
VADFILAHPFLRVSIVANPLSEEGIFSLLDMGLDGVEIYHDKTSPQQIQWLKKMADERKIHYTGGSDFHGKKNDIGLGFYGQDLEITNFEISNFKLS